jgi:hypothetical protein
VEDLRVSRYDQTAALLVALLIIVGIAVAMLVIIWITSRVWTTQQAVPVEFIEELSGRGDAAMGSARDLEEPGAEEVEDLSEPQLEQTLEAVTDAITSQAATLDTLDGEARSSTKGKGLGDSRAAGPGGNGNVIPRWERWQIEYDARTLGEYAQVLDHFGIQLAAFGGGKKEIDYAYNLSKKKPDTGTATREERDKWLYFVWRHGPLRAADRDLLQRAGITTDGRTLMQFFPAEIENQLATLENQKLAGKSLESVQQTVFGVVGDAGRYQFVVLQLKTRS